MGKVFVKGSGEKKGGREGLGKTTVSLAGFKNRIKRQGSR